MASACALAMFSGKNLFAFVVQKRLRAFLYPFFTGGVVKANGSCRAGFLRKQSHSRETGHFFIAPAPVKKQVGKSRRIFRLATKKYKFLESCPERKRRAFKIVPPGKGSGL